MSFGGDPGRDDGGLPPVNIEIPDDARELDRDVLAYRRELRAQRRRQRMRRLAAPFARRGGALPLIAMCVALSMLAGAMLSVFTISPASAPTRSPQPKVSAPVSPAAGGPRLPSGTIMLDGHREPLRNLAPSVLALVPPRCGCGTALRQLASQAATAHVPAYFVASGAAIPDLTGLTSQYGNGTVRPVVDAANLLGATYKPAGLTVLLVHSDAIPEVHRSVPPGLQYGQVMITLHSPSRRLSAGLPDRLSWREGRLPRREGRCHGVKADPMRGAGNQPIRCSTTCSRAPLRMRPMPATGPMIRTLRRPSP